MIYCNSSNNYFCNLTVFSVSSSRYRTVHFHFYYIQRNPNRPKVFQDHRICYILHRYDSLVDNQCEGMALGKVSNIWFLKQTKNMSIKVKENQNINHKYMITYSSQSTDYLIFGPFTTWCHIEYHMTTAVRTYLRKFLNS